MPPSGNGRGKFVAAISLLLMVVVIGWEVRRLSEKSPVLPPPPIQKPIVPEAPPPASQPAEVKRTRPAAHVQKKVAAVPKKKPHPPAMIAALPGSSSASSLKTPGGGHPSAGAQPTPPLVPYRPPPAPAPPQEWRGNNDSAITHPGQVVVRTDEQWVHFWAEHHPDEASPDVDFARSMVIGVFVGSRPADGFSVEIAGIQALPGSLVVYYREHTPPPGTFAVGVTVYPYDIKVLPRSTLPVKFNPVNPVSP